MHLLAPLLQDPKVQPGVIDVVRYWHGMGYLLVYLSARPDMQQRRVKRWLASHNFPEGMTYFVEGITTDPMRQKAALLETVVKRVRVAVILCGGTHLILGRIGWQAEEISRPSWFCLLFNDARASQRTMVM